MSAAHSGCEKVRKCKISGRLNGDALFYPLEYLYPIYTETAVLVIKATEAKIKLQQFN